MDPTTTLRELRVLIQAYEKEDGSACETRDILSSEIVEKIKVLDNWLNRRGFLPTQWDR